MNKLMIPKRVRRVVLVFTKVESACVLMYGSP